MWRAAGAVVRRPWQSCKPEHSCATLADALLLPEHSCAMVAYGLLPLHTLACVCCCCALTLCWQGVLLCMQQLFICAPLCCCRRSTCVCVRLDRTMEMASTLLKTPSAPPTACQAVQRAAVTAPFGRCAPVTAARTATAGLKASGCCVAIQPTSRTALSGVRPACAASVLGGSGRHSTGSQCPVVCRWRACVCRKRGG